MKFKALTGHPLVRFGDFRRFFLARFVSSIGDKFFAIALSWWAVNDAGPNGPMHLGFLMGITLLPAVVLGPISGTLADRYSRKTCMIVADCARLAVMLVMTGLLIIGEMSLPLMYLLVLTLSSFMPLFEASANGCLEALTDEESLSAAAAVNSSVVELSNVLGAALGGVALATLGTAGAFGVDGGTFLLSLLLIVMIGNPLRPERSPVSSTEGGMKELLLWLRRNRDVLGYLCLFGGLNFFAAPLMVSVPMMVKYGFDGPVSWVAFLEGSLALGAVVVAMSVSFLPPGSVSRRVFWGILTTGLAMAAFASSSGLAGGMQSVFVAGGGLALVNAAAMGYFQRRVPDSMRGRFFAVLTAVAYSVMPAALVVNGVVCQIWPVRAVLAVDGAVVALMGALVWRIPGTISGRS